MIEPHIPRAKSVAPAMEIAKHAKGLLQFYLDVMLAANVTLNGESSIFLIHDYLVSLAEWGRTAPGTARHALMVWYESLGTAFPLSNPVVLSDSTVESSDEQKDPPFDGPRNGSGGRTHRSIR